MPPTSYITRAEADTIIAAALISTDRQRAAWTATSNGDKDILVILASEDIDAVAWRGAKSELEVSVQSLQWPRVRDAAIAASEADGEGLTTDDYLDADPTVGSVPGIPAALKRACAMQAAFLAWRAAGLDPLAHEQQAAAMGITSQSEGGVSTSRDLTRATDPWARLCPGAQTAMAKYRRRSGSVV